MPRRYPLRGWIIGILSGIIAVAALIIGSVYGNVHASTLNPKIIAWACAAGLVVFGILATARLSLALGHLVARQSVPAAEGAVRFISSAVGYLIVLFGTFGVLDVSVQRLLVGAGLAGVVLGIAAQQSLGNIFAGLVLIMARPFGVGDHIRIRSGALGGMFDAWVQEMSLTYVTVQTDDGQFMIPNTAMLAAGVGPVPPGNSTPISARPYGATPNTAPANATANTAPANPAPANPAPDDAPEAGAGTGPVQTGPVQTGTVQAGTVQAGTVQAGTVQAGPVQAGPVQAGFVPPSDEPGGV